MKKGIEVTHSRYSIFGKDISGSTWKEFFTKLGEELDNLENSPKMNEVSKISVEPDEIKFEKLQVMSFDMEKPFGKRVEIIN